MRAPFLAGGADLSAYGPTLDPATDWAVSAVLGGCCNAGEEFISGVCVEITTPLPTTFTTAPAAEMTTMTTTTPLPVRV